MQQPKGCCTVGGNYRGNQIRLPLSCWLITGWLSQTRKIALSFRIINKVLYRIYHERTGDRGDLAVGADLLEDGAALVVKPERRITPANLAPAIQAEVVDPLHVGVDVHHEDVSCRLHVPGGQKVEAGPRLPVVAEEVGQRQARLLVLRLLAGVHVHLELAGLHCTVAQGLTDLIQSQPQKRRREARIDGRETVGDDVVVCRL